MIASVFTTRRLEIKQLQHSDLDAFMELFSAPEVIEPIPQPVLSKEEILKRFKDHTDYSKHPALNKRIFWGIYRKRHSELIGICALLTNESNNREIGYRVRSKYWGNGYATEVTKGLIDYCFTVLNLDKLDADTSIANIASVKVLEKFLIPVKEFYSEKYKCVDRRYSISKRNWLQ